MRFLRVYGRSLASLGRDKPIAVFLAFCNLLVAALQFLDPVLFGRVIGLLARSGSEPVAQVWREAVQLLGIWACVGALTILTNIGAGLQAERLAHRNRLQAMSRFFGHVLSLPLSFHGEAHSGRMMKAMLSGADGLFWLWLTFFREQLSTVLSAVVLLPLTLFLNWRLALTLIALVVLFVTFITIVVRRTEAGQQRAQAFNAALAGSAQDALANVMVVQSFSRLQAEQRRFSDIADQVIRHQFPVLNWWAVVNVTTKGASTVSVIFIVMLGTLLHIQGRATVAEIVSFMGFAQLLIGRLDSAMGFATKLFYEMPNLEHFFAVLDTQSSVPEKPDAIDLPPGPGEVAFENVEFGYPGGLPILSGVDLLARPGNTVALVGQTGAGKSTAMALLQRLWDPDAGRITIDGHDLRDVTLESLRRAIGVVFQESMLLNRSIRDNLLIGSPNAKQADLERACRQADAHEFIMRQPNGYDTMVGERGTTLSGGQRQRLAIARALLKDPPILILDEATSALDSATEARVSRALKALMVGRTTFIIAHRLSTVRDANEILVFDQGCIVERGTFEALLARQGRFAELVATQLTNAPAVAVPMAAAA